MSSKVWDIVGDISSLQALFASAATGVATLYIQTLPHNILSQLMRFKAELEDTGVRIKSLSPDRRECLRISTQQGRCSSLETLERRWQGLFDEHFDLVHRVDHSNFLERILPAKPSQLWTDINGLKKAIKALQDDAWRSTTIYRTEDRAQAGVLPMHVTIYPQAWPRPYTSSSELITFGGHPSRLHQLHSRRHSGQHSGQHSSTHARVRSGDSTGPNLSIRPNFW